MDILAAAALQNTKTVGITIPHCCAKKPFLLGALVQWRPICDQNAQLPVDKYWLILPDKVALRRVILA